MEEKDIKIIEKYINFNEISGTRNFKEAIEKLLQAYKQDEKNIEEMAEHISTKNYADDICEFRYDVKGRFHKHCYKGECKQCIIDYFRKKCE